MGSTLLVMTGVIITVLTIFKWFEWTFNLDEPEKDPSDYY